MPSRRSFLGTALVTPLIAGSITRGADPGARDGELAVMTYNLRFASEKPPNDWPTRRPLVADLIRRYRPDVIGTQEGLYGQLRSMEADLEGYGTIGLGRDGGSRGEFMAVFYRRERFEPLAYDHFWLSDTPEVIGSSTWGNSNRRMVTSVHFRDRRTGKEFHLWNTHLDHALQPAREKGAALIQKRLAKLPPSDRVILMGDFNAVATRNTVYDALTKDIGFTDSWFSAAQRKNETLNSFNGFGKSTFNSARIDWILYRGEAEVPWAEVVDLTPGGRQPSDHFPVFTRMRWK